MKNKRVLITYLENGNMQSQVAKEVMFQKMLEEMMEEGREVANTLLQPKSKTVKFTDGSTLSVFPVSESMRGLRNTHIYIDEAVKEIPNGNELISQVLKPTLLHGESEKFDTSGKQLHTFAFEDGALKLN